MLRTLKYLLQDRWKSADQWNQTIKGSVKQAQLSTTK